MAEFRNTMGDPLVTELVNQHNAVLDARANEAIGNYHAADDTVVGGAGAVVPPTDLPESLVALNELWRLIDVHLLDGLVHDTASAEDLTAAVIATDQATAETLVNLLKASFNVHLTEATVHYNNDAVNTIAAADASDLTTLIALLTELQTDYDLHVAGSALSSPSGLVDVITLTDV
jgi:hypothetical protein